MASEILTSTMIHNVTSSDIKVHTVDNIQWISVGNILDIFAWTLEDIRNIGHELIRQANELDAKLQGIG
jgi:hypothetical protein